MHTKQDMADLTEASLIEAFKNDENLKQSSVQIAQKITDNEYDIAALVEKLGFALTSKTIDLRVSGTKILSSTLSNLPRDLLTGRQLEFLSTFFADRMKDQHNVLPAVIDGVWTMINMKNFPDASVVVLLQSFFLNTNCQSHVKSDREKIFKIFKLLGENYVNVLKSMGPDFVYGLITSLDGERDPRNLEFIFTFMPALIGRIPLFHLYEEMFEVFACYFPIDFNPSKTDPVAITRDDLAKKLAYCLVAAEQFAEWTIALALEKLESDLVVAKLDSLELLYISAQKFSPKAMEPHFEQIWAALKKEIFPDGDNQEILHTGLRTLRSILEQACSVPEISHNYQTLVLGTVLPNLSDLNQRLFDYAVSVGLVCVSGDPKFATEKFLNSFLLKFRSTDSLQLEQEKPKIFYIIAQVFQICSMRKAVRDIKTEITAELHAEFLNDLNRENSSLYVKKAAVACLNESVACVSAENRALVYQSLIQLLTTEGIDIDLKDILQHIAKLCPQELQSLCVDKCIKDFSLFSPFVKRKICRNFLHLVKHESFAQPVYDLIFSNIFKTDSNETRAIALDAMLSLLQAESSKFIENIHMNESLTEKIITLIQGGTLNTESLELSAAVLSLIMKHLSTVEQYMIISEYLPKLNLQLESDLFLAKGVLGFMHEDISIDDHFERLTNDLVELSLNSDNESVRTVAHHLLCSLFNKMQNTEADESILHRIVAKLTEEIKQNKAKAVEILSWIGKGLSVRGHDVAGDIIEAIADMLDHPSLSAAANLAFQILSAEYPEIHLPAVKFLFKQRFFNRVLSKIAHKLESGSENHLNAFIYVLKATPHSVLKINIEKIGPVLFKCLELNEVNTVETALAICKNFVQAKDMYFSAHLSHFAPQCLKLALFKNSMNVRITALDLLYEITKYPTYILIPLKVDVVLGLMVALDDEKRLVRAAAVRASCEWFLVGEPTGD